MKRGISIVLAFAIVISLFTTMSISSIAGDYDTIGTAKNISLGTQYSGSITRSDETDFYKFTLNNASSLTYQVSGDISAIKLNVYDAEGVEITSDSQQWSSANYLFYERTIHLIKGTYYLKVNREDHHHNGMREDDEYNSYYILLSANSSNISFETEHNSVSTAISTQMNYQYKGQISHNDYLDYYYLELPDSSKLSIELGGTIGKVEVRVYSQNGQELDQYSVEGNSMGVISDTWKVDLLKGRYYLRISKADFHNNGVFEDEECGVYSFSLKAESANESFVEEQGNMYETFSSAKEVFFNKNYNGQLSLNEDKDYFTFTMPSSGRVNFIYNASIFEHDVFLLDNNGKTIWEQEYLYAGEHGVANINENIDLLGGTYYLYIKKEYHYTGNYNFCLNYTSANESFNETANSQSNYDSFNTAKKINIENNYYGQIAVNEESDYYKFTLSNGGYYCVDFNSNITGQSIIIYNSNQNEIIYSEPYSNHSQQTSEIVDMDCSAGDYYLVINKEYNYTGNYQFIITKKSNICNHSWDKGVDTKAATCTVAGVKTFTCSKCGEQYTQTIAALGHNYSSVVTKPTATAIGYTKHNCTRCSNNYIDTYTAPISKLTLKHSARTANALKVSWNKVKTATGYQVQISTKDGKKWDKYYTLEAGTTVYTFKNLAAGNAYKFRVRFYITAPDGKNYFSPWSSTLTSPTLPSGTSITKLTPAKKAFTAQWKKNAAVNGYQVQYSLKSNFSGAKTITVKSPKTLKAVAKKLNAGKYYYVRIRTYKTISKVNYFSAWSKTYKVKTK